MPRIAPLYIFSLEEETVQVDTPGLMINFPFFFWGIRVPEPLMPDRIQRLRTAVNEPLYKVAATLLYKIQLLLIFHPFYDYFQIQYMAEMNDILNDQRRLFAAFKILKEFHIQLGPIHIIFPKDIE